MLYFFHHYELPLILRQVQLQNMLIRTANSAAAGTTGTRNGTSPVEAEADGEAHMESETIDRDSDSLRPETPSDLEIETNESTVEGAPAGMDEPNFDIYSGDDAIPDSHLADESNVQRPNDLPNPLL